MDHHERQIKERLENMQREPRAQLRGKIICSGAGTSRRRYRKPGGMRLGLKTLLSAMTIVILISATVFAAANAGVLADFFSGISIAKVQPCEDCGKSPCACPDKPSVNLWENDRLYPGLTPACQICGEDEEGCACPDTPPSYACETCGEETCDCVKSPGYAWAGKGTEDDPLQVTTAEQLAEIARLVNAGRLEAQILGDKDATVYIKLMNDISLSAYGEDYNGGNGWIPIGRYVNPKITGYGFNSVFDGDGKTISGLYINDPTAPDWSSVGLSIVGLFGYISGGAVKNLNIADADINAFACIGGVAGHLASGSITNCTVTGNITGMETVGGVVGAVGGEVINCSSAATVNGGGFLGGVVGRAYGNVINCHSTGDVSGTGIPGTIVDGEGNVIDAMGVIGGVVGMAVGDVINCWSTGNVSGTTDVGGVVGMFNGDPNGDGLSAGGRMENCYATGNVSGSSIMVGGVVGCYGTSGDVINCWSTGNVSGRIYVGGVVGWLITSEAVNLKDCYSTGNINGIQAVGGVAGWLVSGGDVINCWSKGNISSTDWVGGVAGRLAVNIMEGCYSEGNVSADGNLVGGVVGVAEYGQLINCWSKGDISGSSYVGGVAGQLERFVSLKDCYFTGKVTGNGLIGRPM